jgi:hypothetical protein
MGPRSILVKCNLEGRTYSVFGYKGKQVRDNIYAHYVARFIEAFWRNPGCGEVYNLGGGRGNSCSILEAFDRVAGLSDRPMRSEYHDQNRAGDHICYISDLRRMTSHYPEWGITRTLDSIFAEIVAAWQQRRDPALSADGRGAIILVSSVAMARGDRGDGTSHAGRAGGGAGRAGGRVADERRRARGGKPGRLASGDRIVPEQRADEAD